MMFLFCFCYLSIQVPVNSLFYGRGRSMNLTFGEGAEQSIYSIMYNPEICCCLEHLSYICVVIGGYHSYGIASQMKANGYVLVLNTSNISPGPYNVINGKCTSTISDIVYLYANFLDPCLSSTCMKEAR